MQMVVEKVEQSTTVVPFAMLFMGKPEVGDMLGSNVNTMTTTYSTACGPQGSPDDGQTSTKDD